MKTSLTLQIITAIGIIFASCNSAKNSIDIVGEWSGMPEKACFFNIGISQGIKEISYEFTKEGLCKITLNGGSVESGSETTISDINYKLVGDSLILTKKSVADFRMAFFSSFSDNDSWRLTLNTENCISSIELKKKNS